METPPAVTPAYKNIRPLLVVILVVYVVAWFMPVYGRPGGPDSKGYDSISTIRGYDAYNFTSNLIFDVVERLGEKEGLGDNLTMIGIAIGPHTNYIIAIALLLLLLSKNPVGRKTLGVFRMLLFLCFVVNLSYLNAFTDDKDRLQIGFYLWLLSFLLTLIACLIVKPVASNAQ
jgi:hypothetical protein